MSSQPAERSGRQDTALPLIAEGPPREPARTGPSTDALRAVYVGIGALVVLSGAAIAVFHNSASTAASVIGAFAAPIATLVGAYFGMRTGTDAGAAGKAEAEQRRTASDRTALALAGLMEPSTARSALRALGVPVPSEPEAQSVSAQMTERTVGAYPAVAADQGAAEEREQDSSDDPDSSSWL